MRYTEENFPRSNIQRDEMKTLQAHIDDISCMVLCDVEYRKVNNYGLHLHIILPTQNKDETRKFPTIIFVQGSAWHKQTLGREIVQLGRIAKLGYVVAIVEYRPSDVALFPAQIIDAKYAVQYMVEHKNEYCVDPNNLILWGTSSGAHTALMASFTNGLDQFKEQGLKEYEFKCVIDYFGPTDVYEMRFQPSLGEHYTKDCPEGLLLGQVVTRENSMDTVVMKYVEKDKSIPPVLIVHGDMDKSVPFHQSVLLYDKLVECNKDTQIYKIRDAGHSGAEFWNKEVLNIVNKFILSNLTNERA